VLIANALGLPTAFVPDVFSLGVTGVLFIAGWAYLQALGVLLRQHWAHRPT
jgi:hypothetical protein